ncbi:MAG: hypothetical protein M3Q10_08605 [Chloroflexota bacterium]|nr:hypothetical protein [Chloroflexota bacterium]
MERVQDPRELRDWLLRLAADVLDREGSTNPSHDADHVARTMALARERHAYMRAFFDRLRQEVEGRL